jgi:hypothetical protein
MVGGNEAPTPPGHGANAPRPPLLAGAKAPPAISTIRPTPAVFFHFAQSSTLFPFSHRYSAIGARGKHSVDGFQPHRVASPPGGQLSAHPLLCTPSTAAMARPPWRGACPCTVWLRHSTAPPHPSQAPFLEVATAGVGVRCEFSCEVHHVFLVVRSVALPVSLRPGPALPGGAGAAASVVVCVSAAPACSQKGGTVMSWCLASKTELLACDLVREGGGCPGFCKSHGGCVIRPTMSVDQAKRRFWRAVKFTDQVTRLKRLLEGGEL